MGGINETVATQKKDVGTGKPVISGKVRYHLKNEGGCDWVHFHDDENGLKVAIPASTWFAAWQRLESGLDNWQYTDLGHKTHLHVSFITTPPNPPTPAKLDVCLSIEKVELSDDFEKLRKFTTDSK